MMMIEAEHAGIEEMNEGSDDDIDREAIQIGKAIIREQELAEAQSIQEKLLDAVFGKGKIDD